MHTSSQNDAPPCPDSVLELVARFALHAETYKQQAYNETQVRREFIDPLFAALGWDIDNRAGHAEAYKDVIHEDAIKIGGSTKAPDYSFRIGGVRESGCRRSNVSSGRKGAFPRCNLLHSDRRGSTACQRDLGKSNAEERLGKTQVESSLLHLMATNKRPPSERRFYGKY